MMRYGLRAYLSLGVLLASICACGSDEQAPATGAGGATEGGGGNASAGGSAGAGGSGGSVVPLPSSACGSARLSQYAADNRAWCGFDRTHSVLPDFVRAGMTLAIAEPYNGSSYEGESGESCGECWEVDTMAATQVVMVHDLCPIEGNELCAGGQFHLDLSSEAAAVLRGDGSLGEASTRRVPCPVTGNIHARISDRNEWGYLKVAFFNHRFPIRTAEYRAVGGDTWLPLARCLARWCATDDTTTFASDGPGAVFRLTSAEGEVVAGTEPLTYPMGDEYVLDTGAQFAPVEPQGASCQFTPPGDVYDENWGGIEGVRWELNTWGDPSVSEIADGCADSSASCVLVSSFDEGDGFHVTYRNRFPTTTFSRLSLQMRARAGGGELEVAPRSETSRCANPTTVLVGDAWQLVEIDVGASCPGFAELTGLTVSRSDVTMDLVVDEIRYE